MSDNKKIIEFFAQYVKNNLGIVYSEPNYYQLEHRLEEVAKNLKFKNIQELYEEAKKGLDKSSKSMLLNIATNNETSFFRDPTLFLALEKSILPDLANRPNQTQINIWSAASSSGQEAYSIAMTIDKFKEETGFFPNFEMQLTDVSDRILEKAEKGIYSNLEVERGLDPILKNKYFDPTPDGQWKIKPFIKNGLRFKTLNFFEECYGLGPFHIIFCRNVLIYFNIEAKQKVIEKLADSLYPSGYLLLGSAENLLGLSDHFEQLNLNGAIVYQLKK